jgi:D-alanyl-D-alanine carboxypeptidase
MKEERKHRILLRVAIITFALGVIVSVIVTGIVMGIIHRAQIRGLEEEFGIESNAVNYGGEGNVPDGNAQDIVNREDTGNSGAEERGRGASTEMIPEILAGGIITPLTENDEELWYLKLVNSNHSVAADFSVELVELPGGHLVDYRIVDDVLEMLESAANQGMELVIVSAFRSYEEQQGIFDNVAYLWFSGGYTFYEAFVATQRTVALPGHSEHQLGLALDIVSAHNQVLDESQSLTLEGQWLRENSWRYGFVLRYLEDKTHITGVFYEPWHFRYVGREAAQYMWENNLVLEEYLLERYLGWN